MKTNDNLLVYMIEQDLKAKGCAYKQLIDVVVHNPKTIEVKANEVVYVHFLHTDAREDFAISITSPNTVQLYSQLNTISGDNNLITRHWGNIKIKGTLHGNYFIHYVRIKL